MVQLLWNGSRKKLDEMMVRLGNLVFHNRNAIFPIFYLLLFIPSPGIFSNPVIAMAIGFSITVLGQLVRVITIGLVYIIRGGKDRRVYAEDLVTTGIFSHCRNPLYVGNILILAGLGVASDSILFNCVATPLFLFFWQVIVLAEEDYLRSKFGGQYEQYCSQVNRWLPKMKGIMTTIRSMEFKWKRVIIREYTATYIWLSGAVLIMMKHFYRYPSKYDFDKNRPVFLWMLVVFFLLYLFTRHLKKSKKLASD